MVRRKKSKISSKSGKKQITKQNSESNSEKDKKSTPPRRLLIPEKKPEVPEGKAIEPDKTARSSRAKDVRSYQRQSSSRVKTGELSLVAVRKGDLELEHSPQVAGGTKATQDQTVAEDVTRGDQQHPDPDQDALNRTIGV